MMKTIKTLLMITLILSLFSCSNDVSEKIDSENSTYPSEDGKTYLVVDMDNCSVSRTILPAAADYSKNKLTDIYLSGKKAGTDTTIQLAHSETYDKFSGRIPIDAGSWELTLTAKLNNVNFSASNTITIEENKLNYLIFDLRTETSYGGLSITVNFNGSADKVVATLQNENKEDIENNPVTTLTDEDFNSSSFTYTRSIGTDKQLSGGTYYILFKFYYKGAPLNTYRSYVRIANGVTTTSTISIDLDETYKINYTYWEGTAELLESELTGLTVTGGATLPERCSRRTEYTLPALSLPGHTFIGWFADAACTEPITQISKGNTSEITLNAQFEVGGGPSLDGFTVFDAGSINAEGIVGQPEGQQNGDVFNIPKLAVCDHLITQTEYEQYMTYFGKENEQVDFYPNETGASKNTTPAYYVSWVEAIVYCNLRSLAEGLTPVYTMDNVYEIRTDDNPWIQDYRINTDESGKYYYGRDNEFTAYDYDQNHIETNFEADGYRLPTTWEYAYILGKDSDFFDTDGFNEWGHNYYNDNRIYFIPGTGAAGDGKATYVREADLGFRVVRKAE